MCSGVLKRGYFKTIDTFYGQHQTRAVAAVLVGLSLISCAASHNGSTVYPSGADNVTHKIDPHLARELSLHQPVDNRVSVLIRTTRTIDAGERHKLTSLGVKVRSTVGAVVTATVTIDAVGAVAALPFVTYIEKAMPVQPAE